MNIYESLNDDTRIFIVPYFSQYNVLFFFFVFSLFWTYFECNSVKPLLCEPTLLCKNEHF